MVGLDSPRFKHPDCVARYYRDGMPRADRISLTPEGLDLPPVDHLSNKGMYNVVLDRHFAGFPSGVRRSRESVGLFVLFTRLTDKALREYDAARAELLDHVPTGGLRIGPYLRAVDHMENCIGALCRATLTAKALRQRRVGLAGPRLTDRQQERLAFFRNAFEHADERLPGTTRNPNIPPFAAGDPYSIRLANTSMVIGSHVLTYKEVVSAMTKCYRTIELIRGIATGDPGPNFANVKLRANDPSHPKVGGPAFGASEYFKQLARLGVSHA
jgi:hypothetical protein